jgi:hypothetical protein
MERLVDTDNDPPPRVDAEPGKLIGRCFRPPNCANDECLVSRISDYGCSGHIFAVTAPKLLSREAHNRFTYRFRAHRRRRPPYNR